MGNKISIVVPVYNSEKTIKKCLNSIINQTFLDMDILIIDDGSTDGSAAICDEYVHKDCRIKVIHKGNGGVSSARNVGIDECQTRYIMFVDSDDFLDETICEKLYKLIISHNTGMACCGFVREFHKDDAFVTSVEILPGSKGIFSLEDLRQQFGYLYEKTLASTPCCKIYDMDVINSFNLKFTTDIYLGEDMLFNLQYLRHSYTIVFLNEALYHYINNSDNNSLTHKFEKNKFDFFQIQFNETEKFCMDMGLQQSMSSVSKMYLKGCFIVIENLLIWRKNCTKNKVNDYIYMVISSEVTKKAVRIRKKRDIEYFIYQNILKTNNLFVVKIFALARNSLKKIIRKS